MAENASGEAAAFVKERAEQSLVCSAHSRVLGSEQSLWFTGTTKHEEERIAAAEAKMLRKSIKHTEHPGCSLKYSGPEQLLILSSYAKKFNIQP